MLFILVLLLDIAGQGGPMLFITALMLDIAGQGGPHVIYFCITA